jgi:TP901 family phage tail tape measure protein
MADNLRLRVVLDFVDRALSPLKRISAGSTEAARALKAAKESLKALNAQQAQVGEFRTLKNELQSTAAKLAQARGKVAELARAYGQTAEPTRAMTRELGKAKREAAALGNQHDAQQVKLQQLRAKLSAAGISTRDLGAHSKRLRTDIAAANATIDQQTAKLRANGEQQRKLAKLREQHSKAMVHAGMVGGAGYAMQAAGRRGVDMSLGPVKTFSKHEDAMLGIARQVPGARDELGQLTPVYKAIEQQVRELSHEVPVATTAIAQMFTAAARMEVPTEQLKEFTRMASEMSTAFDAVPDVITEAMGKVAKNFKMPITSIRGLADTINYLDDNAISKGADIIDFLNRTSGVVSTVAMSAKDAAALGSTLLTLGERTETAGTAANAIVQKFAAATKGTKKFKSAVEEIGLTSEGIQKGMSSDAMGTLTKVLEAIRKLPEDKRIGVMVELVGLEHSDTLAKLVDKPEELARQRELANSQAAQGSMAREAAARNAALSAQWQMFSNRMFNLSAALGGQLAPVLTKVMAALGPVLDALTRFVQNNPALMQWLLGAALGFSALVAVVGAVLVPLALVAGKFMLVRFLLARFMATMGGAGAVATTAAGGMGLLYRLGFMLGRGFALLRTGAVWLFGALRMLAVFLMANPIVAAFAAMAAAAYLVWRNWDGISAGAAALWQDLVAMKDRFFAAGGELMAGLVNGITSRVQAVRDAIVGVANAVGGWFREKLGIASPSKVFMQYGGWISEGAALGIAGGQGAVRNAALAMATAATATMPMAADAAALRIDSRAPLMAHGAGMGAPMGGGTTISITVNAAPGMDEKALARAVAAEVRRLQQADRSRVNSQYSDIDG